MRYLVWVLRLLVFVVVLLFALKNTEPVQVNLFADYVLHDIPLIVVMLGTFILGLLLGLLIMVLSAMRRRREMGRLRRELDRLQEKAQQYEKSVAAPVAPETIAPLAPL
ncbi:lipopolysaccharide assembly protein LapA domain-containing protein [Alcaligenes endophyticus]|uniref:Lipopolysaccharide assembly protein LapA domain-containing protein n=1 Tax=Alcaligenes endophyticus TaxID=1929088 RepID=A0ABT8EIB4_9BURK|nr:lipopolysaccharide assembly protein LapA domain-containing protein [Alcaligenes endophyticus]MCX5592759.1 lipopolysaccharide assembly protein LapA domain-containing protein [Alcaligenes endophyticus]MDN4120947.1 lipopolysaccharide assembly protein LapA domain-containing protein [Alcaligenes endophyticus]